MFTARILRVKLSRQKVSIVIPVFNEELVLPELFTRLSAVIDKSVDEFESELIFVDDGSTDSSANLIYGFSGSRSDAKIISLSRNFGHQAAILAGLNRASGDAVLIMDADLQDPPEIIPKFVAKWLDGADIVYGKRNVRNGETFFKKASASVFYRLISWLTDVGIPRDVGDFRIVDKKLVNILISMDENSLYLRGIFAWMGFRQEPLLYDRDERFAGLTKYPLKKMAKLGWDAVLSFSEKPLALVTRLGALISFVAFSLSGFFIIQSIFYSNWRAPGWLSIILVVLSLSGVQMISIGFIGSYVIRIYRQSKNRPLFLINEKKSTI